MFHQEEQGILPYGLATNDHTGKEMARLKETGVRVVCWNTISFSLNKSEGGIDISVPHTTSVEEKWKEATNQLFSNLVGRYVAMANYRKIFAETQLPAAKFTKLVLDVAYPIAHLENRIQRRESTGHTEAALKKAGEKRGRIADLWFRGKGQTGDHSAWEAYQGLIEHVDHDDNAQKTGGNRVQSLMDGSLKTVKDRVFRGLNDYCVSARVGTTPSILN